MAKRLAILIVTLGFAVAGCGDDGEEKAKNDASTSTVQSDDTDAAQPKPDDSGGSGAAATPEVKQAIEDCKDQAEASPQISSEVKAEIGDICEKSASGDRRATAEAAEKACKAIIRDTATAGPARERALRSCGRPTQR